MCDLACCEGCFYLLPCITLDTQSHERHFRALWWEETGETGEGASEAREGGWRGGEGEDQHQAELLSQRKPSSHLVLDDGRSDCEKHSPDQDYNKEVRPPEMSKFTFYLYNSFPVCPSF